MSDSSKSYLAYKMNLTIFLSLATLLSLVVSGFAQTFHILVGQDSPHSPSFSLDNFTAVEGDVLEFIFPSNITYDVVVSEFEGPCQPSRRSTRLGNFYSGEVTGTGSVATVIHSLPFQIKAQKKLDS